MNNNFYKRKIPIFFATDDNYIPFLAVAIQSIKENASKLFRYEIRILTSNTSVENQSKILKFAQPDFLIEFVDINPKMQKIKADNFCLRDYYSLATYFRFFIADMFPKINKALYLDCDIIVTGDISKLYQSPLCNNLLGAVSEEVMTKFDVFGQYSEKALGIKKEHYFNAGILVLNLRLFRKEHMEEKLLSALSKYTFRVAQDQDYLNIMCKGRVKYLCKGWNRTPILDRSFNDKKLKLVHYKIAWKPWHYDGVLYGEEFWKYAKKTKDFLGTIESIKNNYSTQDKERDNLAFENLVQLALNDIEDSNNYYNLNKGEI